MRYFKRAKLSVLVHTYIHIKGYSRLAKQLGSRSTDGSFCAHIVIAVRPPMSAHGPEHEGCFTEEHRQTRRLETSEQPDHVQYNILQYLQSTTIHWVSQLGFRGIQVWTCSRLAQLDNIFAVFFVKTLKNF